MSSKSVRQARYRAKLRSDAIEHYAQVYVDGKPACEHCGINIFAVLTINHVFGGGRQHRLEVTNGAAGWNFYLWLRKHGWPSGYNVLCANCNMKYSPP